MPSASEAKKWPSLVDEDQEAEPENATRKLTLGRQRPCGDLPRARRPPRELGEVARRGAVDRRERVLDDGGNVEEADAPPRNAATATSLAALKAHG